MMSVDAWCKGLESDVAPWARVAAWLRCEGGELVPMGSRRLPPRPAGGSALARTLRGRREILLEAAGADAFSTAMLEELDAEALLLIRQRGRVAVVAVLVDLAPSAHLDRRRLEAIAARAGRSLEVVITAPRSTRAAAGATAD